MCRLRNIAMRDYQKSVTTGQTDGQTDAGQSDPYVPLCFAGDTKSMIIIWSQTLTIGESWRHWELYIICWSMLHHKQFVEARLCRCTGDQKSYLVTTDLSERQHSSPVVTNYKQQQLEWCCPNGTNTPRGNQFKLSKFFSKKLLGAAVV